jgi:SM-20-related protein
VQPNASIGNVQSMTLQQLRPNVATIATEPRGQDGMAASASFLIDVLRHITAGHNIAEIDASVRARAMAALATTNGKQLLTTIGQMVVHKLLLSEPAKTGVLSSGTVDSPKPGQQSLISPATFIVLEEFLVKQELDALLRFALECEGRFTPSRVMGTGSTEGRINLSCRRSRLLYHLGEFHNLISDRVRSFLPYVLDKLQHPPFAVASVETQLTATNDGEFFKPHSDNTSASLRARTVTFVYYFHQEPKKYSGGDLHIYDSEYRDGRYIATGTSKTIVPRQNEIVFFPSFLVHEVLPVRVPSRAFADSRFTLNGWVHR